MKCILRYSFTIFINFLKNFRFWVILKYFKILRTKFHKHSSIEWGETISSNIISSWIRTKTHSIKNTKRFRFNLPHTEYIQLTCFPSQKPAHPAHLHWMTGAGCTVCDCAQRILAQEQELDWAREQERPFPRPLFL